MDIEVKKGLSGERAGVQGRLRQVVAVVLVVLIIAFTGLVSTPEGRGAAADPKSDEAASTGTPSGAALQAASWLITIPYGAVKVGFALLGGVVGGLTYALSGGNAEAAQSVWTTTMYGTYVITPEHLKGEKPVRFLGIPDRVAEPSSEKAN